MEEKNWNARKKSLRIGIEDQESKADKKVLSIFLPFLCFLSQMFFLLWLKNWTNIFKRLCASFPTSILLDSFTFCFKMARTKRNRKEGQKKKKICSFKNPFEPNLFSSYSCSSYFILSEFFSHPKERETPFLPYFFPSSIVFLRFPPSKYYGTLGKTIRKERAFSQRFRLPWQALMTGINLPHDAIVVTHEFQRARSNSPGSSRVLASRKRS